MNIVETLLVIAVAVTLAEVTYLVVKLPRQAIGRGRGRSILVDTSVLIDGRIISVAKSGFIGDTLVIPRSVVRELQYLADNADHEKRARARYGLDVVKELQALESVTVEILADGVKVSEGVDERLLTLAKKYNAAICTIDYNLNKVAVVEGITVLNVNELAQSLRMAYLPGERMHLELVQKGQDPHQGVGYLPDGTMVVVEFANKYVGQIVEIEFIRSLQTAAGKMMFARRVETSQPPKPMQKPSGKKPVQQSQNQQPPASPKAIEASAAKPQQTKEQSKQHSKPTQQTKNRGNDTTGNKAVKSQPAVVPTPTAVYHSDEREAKKINKVSEGSRVVAKPNSISSTPEPSAAAVVEQLPATEPKKNTRRRKNTSEAREASLIDLVNKQQD